jgi:hypothetical protein
LTILPRGNALVFAEGCDHPYHIIVENTRSSGSSHPLDTDIQSLTKEKLFLNPYLSVPDFSIYGVKKGLFSAPDNAIYQITQQYLSKQENIIDIARIILRTLFYSNSLTNALSQLQFHLMTSVKLNNFDKHDLLLQTLVFGISNAMQDRGAERGWNYTNINQIRVPLTKLLTKTIKDSTIDNNELEVFRKTYIASTKQENGYYPGCSKCKSKCLYHLELNRLITKNNVMNISSIFKTNMNLEEKYKNTKIEILELIKQWLEGECNLTREMAYCASLIMSSRLGLDDYAKNEFSKNILAVL